MTEPQQGASTSSSGIFVDTITTITYAAYLSVVAREFRKRIVLVDRVKNGIEYKNVFDGREAVDKLVHIINDPKRRDIALRLGRALGAQRFFHDVNYDNRLIDTDTEIYQFYDDNEYYTSHSDTSSAILSAGTMTTASSNMSDLSSVTMLRDADAIAAAVVAGTTTSQHYNNNNEDHIPNHHEEEDDVDSQVAGVGDTTANGGIPLPNGIFTDLTHCYVPTCVGRKPCYSFACPKREVYLYFLHIKREENHIDARLARSTTHAYLRQQEQPLWSNVVSQHISNNVSQSERKRQETIFELAYTEDGFVKDLEYVNQMWIQPLRKKDIIPLERRETFIDKVFCNIMTIHELNYRFLSALRARQKENPIVAQIGDVVLDFVVQLEPFLLYGARQHEAKYMVDTERSINPKFAAFAEQTERHPSSYRLELDGYLSKPTARLGRYTLILDAILKHTPDDDHHPDRTNIPKATDIIKQFLTRVNEENGKAKNRFDLERIDQKLLFRHDKMDLRLLDENRKFIKQVKLRKTANPDAPEYHLLLFDHYLVITKAKLIRQHERYVVKRKPIPLELLEVTLQSGMATRPSVDLNRSNTSNTVTTLNDPLAPSRFGYPITFQHLGRRGSGPITLFATALPILKPWMEQIQIQQALKSQRTPIFELVPAIQERRFLYDTKVNHLVTFNNGKQYVMATDVGVFVGHTGPSSRPHKVLSIDKAIQVEVLEDAQLLLVLADKTLWEYSLEVLNNQPDKQPAGRRIQGHVPHFHVGTSLNRKLVCVPRVSTLNSTITLFEPARPQELVKSKNFLGKLVRMPASDIHLRRFKECYVPSEAWAVELSASLMLITCPRGIVMVDLVTRQPQQMLNPADRSLTFVTERENDESRKILRSSSVKHIAVFKTPRNDHLVCYDEYAFYIDSKGNRTYRNFRIEFEGSPEAYAFSYPYVIAFDPNFIEVRHVITGELEQIIRGRDIQCINNGHKTEKPYIFGVMTDRKDATFQYIFQLQPVFEDPLLSTTSLL
ncbi:hypothetical protein BDA99DRAFT_448523 [Phascolomyces articulosus]|uniref:Rho1 guanine nucleotide exchange factor 1 n=1 Tax=Phascolomyces articulosus TaxID=60185 RepID=A0AAD5JZJ4_9FUNG|nr:hypothetical protein BDA99DRAFT_448523 [Phascolomyces articulosus]